MKSILLLIFEISNVVFAQDLTNNLPMAYRVSDTDIKIFIRQVNNIEQCIFPELSKPNYEQIYQKWTLEEHSVMKFYQDRVLESLIGRENFLKLSNDPNSLRYFAEKSNQYNHQRANVDPELCQQFKWDYQQKFAKAKELIKAVQSKEK